MKRTVRQPGNRLAFTYRSEELGRAVELIPFYDIHCQRVATYLPHVEGAACRQLR